MMKFGHRPDLILVDGGQAHVEVKPLIPADIAVAGIVKDKRHRTRGLVYRVERSLSYVQNLVTTIY